MPLPLGSGFPLGRIPERLDQRSQAQEVIGPKEAATPSDLPETVRWCKIGPGKGNGPKASVILVEVDMTAAEGGPDADQIDFSTGEGVKGVCDTEARRHPLGARCN